MGSITRLRSEHLQADIDNDTLAVVVTDRRNGTVWRMQNSGPGDIGLKGHCGPWQGMAFASARERRWEASESEAEVILGGWPYAANVWSPAALGVIIRFSLQGAALRIGLSPHRPEHGEISLIDSYYPRGFLFPEGDSGKLVLPYGQGCLLDRDFPHDLDMVQPGWVGIGFTMPWWGQLTGGGSGLIALPETPDDLGFRLKTESPGGLTVHPYWQASLGGLRYERAITYEFHATTTVPQLARRYRQHAEARMSVTTLAERAVERPSVDLLRGGMQAAVWAMSTFPDRILQADFATCTKRYRRLMEGAGIERAICHVDGWGKDGYDYNHPDVLPPDERLGGWEGLRRMADEVRALGHGFLLHDNYVDYYAHTAAFQNDDGVLDLSNMHSESTEWLGGRQQWLCATRAMRYARQNAEELAERLPMDGIYVDCWTIGHLRECFDQRHLADRAAARRAWSEVFAMFQGLGWLSSSEGGNDWAVPVVDFCHTVQPEVIPHPLRDIAASFGTPIPLYAMVWHDCLGVPGWIEMKPSRAVIREGCVVQQKRDMRLWTLLWCGIPSFRTPSLEIRGIPDGSAAFEEEVAFVRELKVIADFSAKAGFLPLTHWECSSDGEEQSATYGGEATVTVDFNRNRYVLKAPGLERSGSFGSETKQP